MRIAPALFLEDMALKATKQVAATIEDLARPTSSDALAEQPRSRHVARRTDQQGHLAEPVERRQGGPSQPRRQDFSKPDSASRAGTEPVLIEDRAALRQDHFSAAASAVRSARRVISYITATAPRTPPAISSLEP